MLQTKPAPPAGDMPDVRAPAILKAIDGMPRTASSQQTLSPVRSPEAQAPRWKRYLSLLIVNCCIFKAIRMPELPFDPPKEAPRRGPAAVAAPNTTRDAALYPSRHPRDVSLAAARSPALSREVRAGEAGQSPATSGFSASPTSRRSGRLPASCSRARRSAPSSADLQSSRAGQLTFDFRLDAQPARIIELKPRTPEPFGTEAPAPRAPSLGTPGTLGTIGTGVFGAISSAEQYFLMGSLLDDGTPERMDEAVKAYRRALEEDPDLVAALINLANIRYSRDELAEAQALYERAIALDDSYFEAHFNLGNIHHDHGALRRGRSVVSQRARAQQRLCRRALLPRGDAREDGPLDRRPRALEGLRAPRAARRVGRARPRILRLAPGASSAPAPAGDAGRRSLLRLLITPGASAPAFELALFARECRPRPPRLATTLRVAVSLSGHGKTTSRLPDCAAALRRAIPICSRARAESCVQSVALDDGFGGLRTRTLPCTPSSRAAGTLCAARRLAPARSAARGSRRERSTEPTPVFRPTKRTQAERARLRIVEADEWGI